MKVEIRLYRSTFSGTYCRALSFDGKRWKFRSYEGDASGLITENLDSMKISNVIYDSLKSWSAFDIPSHDKLKFENDVMVDDGSDYVFMYNIDKKFGIIDFRNPESFLKYNKELKELQTYYKIVQIFFPDWE